MITRDPDASFDTPNVVIGRQGRNELTLSFRPHPYLHRLLGNYMMNAKHIAPNQSLPDALCVPRSMLNVTSLR